MVYSQYILRDDKATSDFSMVLPGSRLGDMHELLLQRSIWLWGLLSLACYSPTYHRAMTKRNDRDAQSRPRRLLLHIVRKKDNWMGRARALDRDAEYQFASLDDLKSWLDDQPDAEAGS